MAILGTLIDVQTTTRVGDALAGVTLTTLPHSLPATNPQQVDVGLTSIQDAMNGAPVVFGLGGNASLLTIGFSNSKLNSLGSMPTVALQVISQVFHTIIR